MDLHAFLVNFFLSDCSSTTLMLPNLPSEISCYNHDTCTAFTCCMEIVKFNNRPIEVSINFDECANFLTVTIERISKTVYLHDFSYGLLFYKNCLNWSNGVKFFKYFYLHIDVNYIIQIHTMYSQFTYAVYLICACNIFSSHRISFLSIGSEYRLSLKGIFEIK